MSKSYNQDTRFQFHKGTIRTMNCMFLHTYILYFNSIKVRLEHVKETITFSIFINFNSIKVRLEQSGLSDIALLLLLFQFHKGTIRTKPQSFTSLPSIKFQFHKGTIRTSVFHLNYKLGQ